MVEITNLSTLQPQSITIEETGKTITVEPTGQFSATINTGAVTIVSTAVNSVNGQTGDVVLDTDDISEGITNVYYTDARTDAYLQSGNITAVAFQDTTLTWNADDGTLEFPVNGEVTLQIGQENLIHVKNLSGSALANGDVVYVTGASGSKITVDRADSLLEGTSAATIAVMTQALNDNAVGYATTQGLVRGLDTSTFAEGAALYLNSNGAFSAVKPQTPHHLVPVGWVVRSHATEGSIFVHINNGQELEELHDVLVVNSADGDFLKWNNTAGYWENVQPTTNMIAEGTNLYFTDARVQSYLTANNYATQSDIATAVANLIDGAPLALDTLNELAAALGDDPNFATTITTQLGNKLNTADFNTTADTWLAGKSTTDVAEGTNLYYTDERVDDRIANTIVGGQNITVTYDDIANTLTITSTGDLGYDLSSNSTDDLAEGAVNLYYTNARATGAARAAISATGSLSYNPTTGEISYTQPTNVSAFTNDAGYLTSYTETDPTVPTWVKGIQSFQPSNWDTAYSWGDHALAGYLTSYTETDPVFAASAASGIAAQDITNWNTAYGWGDHSAAGYLTSYTETDPVFAASAASGIAAQDITNWNTAYGWGDHSAAGYMSNLTDDTTPQLGGTLDTNNQTINNLQGQYFVLGNGGALVNAGRSYGATTATEVAAYTGSDRLQTNSSINKVTLANAVTGSNGRVRFNYFENTLDMNSFDFTSTGFGGLVSLANNGTVIANTGSAPVTLAQHKALILSHPYFLGGTNVSVTESTAIDIGNGVADYYGTGTNSAGTVYGLRIRPGDGGTTPSTLWSIYTDANAGAAYIGDTLTIGAITLPNTDGTTGQVLTTDGFGNVTWATPTGGGASAIGDLTDVTLTNLQDGQYLVYNSTSSVWENTTVSAGSGIANVVEDVSPQLGGTLDVNGFAIDDLVNPKFVLGNGSAIVGSNARGATTAFNQNWDGLSQIESNSRISKTTLTAAVTGGNGRLKHNTEFSQIDLNSNSFTTTGSYGRGYSEHWMGNTINNTGNGAATLAAYNGIYQNPVFFGGNANTTISEYSAHNITLAADDYYSSGNSVNKMIGVKVNAPNNVNVTTSEKLSLESLSPDVRMKHAGAVILGSDTAPFPDYFTINSAGPADIQSKSGQLYTPMLKLGLNSNIQSSAIQVRVDDSQGIGSSDLLEMRKDYEDTIGNQGARVRLATQIPDVANATTTPQIGVGMTLKRPVYNTQTATVVSTDETLFNFNNFGTSGFWLDQANGVVTPARQNISFGFPVNTQAGFDNPYAFNNGDQALFSLVTSAGGMINKVIFSWNEGSVSQFNAIVDNVWTATGHGVWKSDYDPFWAFGTGWAIECIVGISSTAGNATVTVDKALPPSGIIAIPGGFANPLFANTPSWANTTTKAITMTRPATGKTYYRWVIEWFDNTLFVRDWEEFNLS